LNDQTDVTFVMIYCYCQYKPSSVT